MTVHIVIGIRENVYQDRIGEPFTKHPARELVRGFLNKEDATTYISNQKLKKVSKRHCGDTAYYKNGYFELEIEEVDVI